MYQFEGTCKQYFTCGHVMVHNLIRAADIDTYMKRVNQHSTENCGFSPGTAV